jgi:peptidoglycan/xylan/chitin deacetylase (PgdA/CDA1 family)
MTPNLWETNTPQKFWRLEPDPPAETWNQAIQNSIPVLGFPPAINSLEDVLAYSLGEARFGKNHFKMGSIRYLYYLLKPYLPRSAIFRLRHLAGSLLGANMTKSWPVEARYVKFQWEILRQVLLLSEKQEISFRYFWPEGKEYAFVLTHDIETAEGQRLVPVLADMEEALGFHSMFNFVPEVYPLDWGLIRELQTRGFEIGVHGLKHDSRMFDSFEHFQKRSKSINGYFQKFQARGFRAPLTIRNPEWMQSLEMEYDLSFFDTDPYEPIPGGVMSIWPFTIGRFTELPYTLPQDCTLYKIMGQTTPQIWLNKIDFLKKYHGMALVIVHPDYSAEGKVREIYGTFLREMSERSGYWSALPGAVTDWWQQRAADEMTPSGQPFGLARATLVENNLKILLPVPSDELMIISQYC